MICQILADSINTGYSSASSINMQNVDAVADLEFWKGGFQYILTRLKRA